MKFITEDELRYLYKQEPFTSYDIEKGVRLTPGARQFLIDRGIYTYDEEPEKRKISLVDEKRHNEEISELRTELNAAMNLMSEATSAINNLTSKISKVLDQQEGETPCQKKV